MNKLRASVGLTVNDRDSQAWLGGSCVRTRMFIIMDIACERDDY
jgi:hypothetical protein